MVLLLQYTLIFASVLMLVALGGCFSEHSGVINLGLEGIMVIGALGGALAMRYMANLPPFLMVIVVLLWLYMSGQILVLGAEFSAALIDRETTAAPLGEEEDK